LRNARRRCRTKAYNFVAAFYILLWFFSIQSCVKSSSAAGQLSIVEHPKIAIRRATAADAEVCGEICYKAFTAIAKEHNFPPDFPGPARAMHLVSTMFSHPGFYCVVAEESGRILGSNCLDERGTVAGVGPITIAPDAQNKNVGKRLMVAVMDRSDERGFPGIRLVQAGYHMRSLSLYAKLGFVVREHLACMQGPPLERISRGYTVRAAEMADLEACNELCYQVHGHDRAGELKDAIQQGTAVIAERYGKVCAYASAIAFFGHAVAENNRDLQVLIAAAKEFQGPGILVPTRNSELFRWCLDNGLRATQSMTLMTMGLYNEPAGAYLPSILY
jgi:GNAT superfamily N-acetyltransferase